jgi:hypothetical protein
LADLAWIAAQPGRGNAGQRRGLVVVGAVARNPHRADDRVVGGTDQHAARHRDQRAAHHVRHCRNEMRPLLRALAQCARPNAHRQRAVCLAVRDLVAAQAGAVLGGERLRHTARIEHQHRQRLEFCCARVRECGGDDGLSLLQG